jgi:hypothetical protein
MYKFSLEFKNCPYPVCFRHNGSQMTAIAWAYISRGFVIGADGRRMDESSGLVASDSVQKVFSVRIPRLRLVYAWSGTTVLKRRDGLELDFTFVTDEILQSVDMAQTSTFWEFVQQFSDCLYAVLLPTIGNVVYKFDKDEIARLLFLGYFDDKPFTSEIFVRHEGPKLLRPIVEFPFLSTRFDGFSGAKKACEIFGNQVLPDSLLDAAKLVRKYIELCFIHRDPPLEGENPIGGHIHIGKFPPEGFSWISQPK